MRNMKRRFLYGALKKCKNCGSVILFQGYEEKTRLTHIMERHQICYDCAYWKSMIEHPPKNLQVVGDKILKVCPYAESKNKSEILGGKGKNRYFIRSNFTVFKSNDVWLIATIPDKYKEFFPETACEISRELYEIFSRNKRRCKAKACKVRSICMRYRFEIDNSISYDNPPTQDANTVDEGCCFFLNMNKYDSNSNIMNYLKRNYGRKI